jgi:hypothetical protein
LARAFITGSAAFALYLLFAGQVSASEAGTGLVLAVAATIWAWLIRRCSDRTFEGGPEHLRVWGRALGGLPGATWRTGLALGRAALAGGSPGLALRHPFRYGPVEDGRDRARRASAVLAASLAPDSFVIRLERERDEVLVHTLERRAGEPDPRWLV